MTTTATGRLTPEELREQHGLEIYETIQGLTGKHPERGIVKSEFHEEILGVERGQVVAMPPANPTPKDTRVRWNRQGYEPQWAYRVEGPHWQADLFISAEKEALGSPVYDLFDRLEEIIPDMKRAVEETPPWTQEHNTMGRNIKRILEGGGQDRSLEGRHGLHQRYG